MEILLETDRMRVSRFVAPPLETNCYYLTCRATGTVALIDVGMECPYVDKLSAIFLTHSHWDHIAGLAGLQKRASLPTWVHPNDRANVAAPGSDGVPQIFSVAAAEVHNTYGEGDSVEVGALVVRVFHTPGHSPGSVCLYDEEGGVLFSGDTLFRGSFGNVAFPSSSVEDMIASLKRLSSLPDETLVYPGHGPSTRIGDESWLARADAIFS